MSQKPLESTAVTLRREFDASFAQPREAAHEARQSFLAIRVGGDPYAVRLSEIASLHGERKIVALPSRTPHFLGLVGLRGAMAPVYDLGSLLGYAVRSAPRRFLLVRTPDPVGLAFELFEAHLQISATAVSITETGITKLRHVSGAIRTDAGIHPLIHVASLMEAITAGVNAVAPARSL